MSLDKALNHGDTASTARTRACKAGKPSTRLVGFFQVRESCLFAVSAVSPWFKKGS